VLLMLQNCLGIMYAVHIENMNVSLETIIGNILGCVYVPTAGECCVPVLSTSLVLSECVNDVCLSVCVCVCVCLSVYLSICLHICLLVCTCTGNYVNSLGFQTCVLDCFVGFYRAKQYMPALSVCLSCL